MCVCVCSLASGMSNSARAQTIKTLPLLSLSASTTIATTNMFIISEFSLWFCTLVLHRCISQTAPPDKQTLTRVQRLRVRAADFMIMLIWLAHTPTRRPPLVLTVGRRCAARAAAPDRRLLLQLPVSERCLDGGVVGRWCSRAAARALAHGGGHVHLWYMCFRRAPVSQERYTTTFEIECHRCSENWDVFSLLLIGIKICSIINAGVWWQYHDRTDT